MNHKMAKIREHAEEAIGNGIPGTACEPHGVPGGQMTATTCSPFAFCLYATR